MDNQEPHKLNPLPALPYLVNLIFFLSDREMKAARIPKLTSQKIDNRDSHLNSVSLNNREDSLV